jgi:hypothetical protein
VHAPLPSPLSLSLSHNQRKDDSPPSSSSTLFVFKIPTETEPKRRRHVERNSPVEEEEVSLSFLFRRDVIDCLLDAMLGAWSLLVSSCNASLAFLFSLILSRDSHRAKSAMSLR